MMGEKNGDGSVLVFLDILTLDGVRHTGNKQWESTAGERRL